ncbi:unnamed protein product [Cyprideis torosa]|uniref:Serine/threonine-protein kinase 40 n=1 Tax=Cyprideis torosa TaxID=163714 RepID=A0A7R8W3N5_9CRUS|nr:unnamed protein product [Cyprideis torosa]CAG0879096.1 unnamed protein product [Cyprideis torosa]
MEDFLTPSRAACLMLRSKEMAWMFTTFKVSQMTLKFLMQSFLALTMQPKKVSFEPPVHKGSLVDRTIVFPPETKPTTASFDVEPKTTNSGKNPQELHCRGNSSFNLEEDGICDDVEDYPTDLVRSLMKMTFQNAAEEVANANTLVDIEPLRENELLDIHVRRKGSHEPDGELDVRSYDSFFAEPVCSSQVSVIYPQMGRNRNDETFLIVNDRDSFVQGVRVEKCMREGAPCQVAASFGYETFCKQKYAMKKLLAMNPTKGQKRIVTEQFRLRIPERILTNSTAGETLRSTWRKMEFVMTLKIILRNLSSDHTAELHCRGNSSFNLEEDGICDDVEDYPTDLVRSLMKKTFQNAAEEVANAYNLIDIEPLRENELLGVHVRRKGSEDGDVRSYESFEESVCSSQEIVMKPRAGRNTNGETTMIVNDGDLYVQAVVVEKCMREGAPCEVATSFGYETFCKQKYGMKKLLVVNETKQRIVIDQFDFPVSPYSLTCSRRGIKYSGRTEKRISLILDCYVAHDFDTESLKNVNLQYYVIKGQKLPESKALYIFASIADTLKRLHDLNVVHRDIKLANLVLDITTSTVRWINFSYGRHLLVSDEALGEQRGSPAYISPELLTGKTYKGKPADVWAAGVVLYTMLYGTFPFYHPTTSSLLRMIASGVYQIPADGRVSMGTIELIKGMLSHDPNDRMTAGNILERVMSLAPLQRPPASAKRESDQVVPDKEEPSSKGAVPAVVPTWFRPLNTSSPFQPPAPRSSRQSSRERIVTSSDSSSEASAASPNHRLVSVTRRDAAERGLPSFRSQFFRHPTTTTSSGSTTTTSPAVISMMLFRPTPPATSNAANSVANVNRGSDLASSDSSAPPAPAPAPRNVPTTTDRSPAALANAIIGSIRRTPFSSGPSRHAPRNFPPARTPAPSAGSTSFMRALSEPSSPPPPVPSGSTAVVPSGRVARGGQLAVADALGSPVPRSSRTAASYLAPYPYMHQRSEGALIPHNPQDASLMSGPLIDSGTGIGARRPAVGFSFSRGGMVVTHTGRDARRLTTAQEVRELFSNQFRSVGEYGNADPRTDSLATVPDVVLSTGNTASEDVDGTACERASLLRLRTERNILSHLLSPVQRSTSLQPCLSSASSSNGANEKIINTSSSRVDNQQQYDNKQWLIPPLSLCGCGKCGYFSKNWQKYAKFLFQVNCRVMLIDVRFEVGLSFVYTKPRRVNSTAMGLELEDHAYVSSSPVSTGTDRSWEHSYHKDREQTDVGFENGIVGSPSGTQLFPDAVTSTYRNRPVTMDHLDYCSHQEEDDDPADEEALQDTLGAELLLTTEERVLSVSDLLQALSVHCLTETNPGENSSTAPEDENGEEEEILRILSEENTSPGASASKEVLSDLLETSDEILALALSEPWPFLQHEETPGSIVTLCASPTAAFVRDRPKPLAEKAPDHSYSTDLGECFCGECSEDVVMRVTANSSGRSASPTASVCSSIGSESTWVGSQTQEHCYFRPDLDSVLEEDVPPPPLSVICRSDHPYAVEEEFVVFEPELGGSEEIETSKRFLQAGRRLSHPPPQQAETSVSPAVPRDHVYVCLRRRSLPQKPCGGSDHSYNVVGREQDEASDSTDHSYNVLSPQASSSVVQRHFPLVTDHCYSPSPALLPLPPVKPVAETCSIEIDHNYETTPHGS